VPEDGPAGDEVGGLGEDLSGLAHGGRKEQHLYQPRGPSNIDRLPQPGTAAGVAAPWRRVAAARWPHWNQPWLNRTLPQRPGRRGAAGLPARPRLT
jgi:hypothetical protein